jgi:hypothetical protein
MKKTTILLFTSFISFIAQAQFDEGTKSIDGNLILSRTPFDFVNQINANIQPSYGVCVKDNLMLITNLGINYIRQSTSDPQLNLGSNDLNLNLSSAIRHYFHIMPNTKAFVSLGCGLEYNSFDSNLYGSNNQYNNSKFNYYLGAGGSRNIVRNVVFEASFTMQNLNEIRSFFGFKNYFTDSLIRSTVKTSFSESGTFMLAGQLEVNFLKQSSFSFNPSFGYFAFEDWMFGLRTSTHGFLDSMTKKLLAEGQITPFIKYYQPILGEHLYATIELSGDLFFGKQAILGTTLVDANYPNLNLVLGATYFLNDHIAIETDLYRFQKTYINTSLASNPEYKTIGLNASLRYFFR